MRYTLLVLLAACVLVGCPPPPAGPAVDITHPAGRAYTLRAVAPLPDKQPTTEGTVDPLATYRGQPGRALPPGAVVTRFPHDEARAVGSRARHADPATHPWVFVEVTGSPIAKHVGWTGWVHTSLLGDGAAAAQPPGTADLLSAESYLCAWPDGAPEPGDSCGLSVHPSLLLDVLGCEGNYAHLQLWDPTGNYVAGFIRRDHFRLDPCSN